MPQPSVNHIAALSLKTEHQKHKNASPHAISPAVLSARSAATAPGDWPATHSACTTPTTMDITTDQDTFQFPTPSRRPHTAKMPSARADFFNLATANPASTMSATTLMPGTSCASPLASSYAKQHSDMDVITSPVRAHTTRETRQDEMDLARPKLSRWRSLGGMFRKKSQKTPVTDSFQHSPELHIPPRSTTSDSFSSASPDKQPGSRSKSVFKRTGRKLTKVMLPPASAYRTHQQLEPFPPHLDIRIPEAQMGRYSELFGKLPTLPSRYDSLRILEEHDGSLHSPAYCSSPTTSLSGANRIRRDTEPCRSSRRSPSSPASQHPLASGADHLPHIFSLASSPKALQRYNTAPILSSALARQVETISSAPTTSQKPTGDNDEASSSSAGSSPTTPTWQDAAPFSSYDAKPIFSASTDSVPSNSSTDVFTVTSKAAAAQAVHRSADTTHDDKSKRSPKEAGTSQPQVAIARSLSVTRAGSRAGMRPTRVNSKKRKVAMERPKVHLAVVPPSVPEKTSAGATETAARPRRVQNVPLNRTVSRKEELQRDLSHEIWGQHGNFVTQTQLQQKKSLVANLCIIDDSDARKSVYAVMDEV